MSPEFTSNASHTSWPESSLGDTSWDSEEPPQILLIDDEPLNCEILASLLGREFSVRFALNGIDGLRMANLEPRPALVLLDVMMDGMDGFEVFARLRRNRQTNRIPVIFLTGLDDASSKERAIRMGAVDYIHKPFRPQSVRDRVRTHIELSCAFGMRACA